MKISKLLSAMFIAATCSVASNAVVLNEPAPLGGLATNEGDGVTPDLGSVAVAVIVPRDVYQGLQKMLGFPDGCIGVTTKVCMPSLEEGEVRSLFNGKVNATIGVSKDGVTWFSQYDTSGFTGTPASSPVILRTYAPGAVDALTQFVGSGFIDNKGCGVGQPLAAPAIPAANSAGVIAAMTAGPGATRVGAVLASELVESDQFGVIKIDGDAPDLAGHLSGNYPIVSNLHGSADLTMSEVDAFTTTFGAASGAPAHNAINGVFAACAPVDVGGAIVDAGK